jgi:hypothetical protein
MGSSVSCGGQAVIPAWIWYRPYCLSWAKKGTAIGTALLYLLASLLRPIPYERWRK